MQRYLVQFFLIGFLAPSSFAEGEPLRLLFLGDQGHHQPARRFQIFAPMMQQRGIELRYTEDVDDLNRETLRRYDGLVLYANIDKIDPDQAEALLEFVASGGGFVPLHCATYCFRNSPEIVALMGAQFKRHGRGVMTTESSGVDHPVTRGYESFSSWDETYVHHLHNEKDRTVLEYRRGDVQAEGNRREPWTWVRAHGAGRVFYTAWGHDERTWNQPGFHQLVERGIRWACGQDDVDVAVPTTKRSNDSNFVGDFPVPEMTRPRTDAAPMQYVDVGSEIPNYTPSQKWGVQGQPLNQMQAPLSPEESMKHMVTPEGFHLELFASEPDLGGKPICMTWDARGRLWVAETYDYPNELQPAGQGRDRIRICEDTDGDGRADRFTVFAEQLSIPSSITFHRDGVIVQNGVETLLLKDTDGDDRADRREVLFENWTLGDTHGGVSNFQYGLDNWVWAMQGYNQSSPRRGPAAKPGDELPDFRMGFFRFRPDGSELEFLRSTNNNTWGLGISEEGLVFGSTANRNPSVFMGIPNRYYERVRGWAPSLTLRMISPDHLFNPVSDKVRQVDHHGGYTAGAGHALYTARAYPKQYWNRVAFVNGPTGKLVGAFVLTSDGAGFRSVNSFNLLASDDEWTAPIMAEVGPDGNVWVIDWYNYIVQHNPTPKGFETGKGRAYVTKLRDKKHGRIYRVVHDSQTDSDPVPDLRHATPVELVKTLQHPTMPVRKHAQRLLVERGARDVVPDLLKLVDDKSVDEAGLNVGAIHALWTLHGLGAIDGPSSDGFALASAAVSHPSAGVRVNALKVLPDAAESLEVIVESDSLRDPNAQVRLAALLAISDIRSADAGEPVAETVSSLGQDEWLLEACTSAAAMHAPSFLNAVMDGSQRMRPTTQTNSVVRVVAEHFARGKPNAESIEGVLTQLTVADPVIIPVVIDGLFAGWPADHDIKLSAASSEAVKRIFRRGPEQSKGTLVRLANQWGVESLRGEAAKIMQALVIRVQNDRVAVSERIDAANQLIQFDPTNGEGVASIAELIDPLSPPELAVGLIQSIGGSRVQYLGDLLVAKTAEATPIMREALVTVMMSRPELTRRMLQAVHSSELQISDLSPSQRQGLSMHPEADIRKMANRAIRGGGNTANPDRAKLVAAKLPLADRVGDIENGKAVFKKNCANCHVLHGEGNVVGPNLTGMSVHPKSELLTHILDPNRSVEANYRLYTALTIDGVVISGVLATESRTAIEIVDAQAKRHSVLREDIEQLRPSRKSAMPEGMESTINDAGLTDLLEYLTQKGDYVPIMLDKHATVVTTKGMFYRRDNARERFVFDSWGTKTVDGVPFELIDPRGDKVNNAIMLHGPIGPFAPKMPKSVMLTCGTEAKALHLLGGVAGWASKQPGRRGVSMIVRLHYADGKTEDHPLIDGQHIADYIGLFDVPKSKLAFDVGGRQLRYIRIEPKKRAVIQSIELIKPDHKTAPLVLAITAEPGVDTHHDAGT